MLDGRWVEIGHGRSRDDHGHASDSLEKLFKIKFLFLIIFLLQQGVRTYPVRELL